MMLFEELSEDDTASTDGFWSSILLPGTLSTGGNHMGIALLFISDNTSRSVLERATE